MTKPQTLNILGVPYEIIYVDNPAEVDWKRRSSLWGQVDYWERKIRVYDKDRPLEDLWKTILHEVLHALADELKLRLGKDENHDELDILSGALADTLIRNGLLR